MKKVIYKIIIFSIPILVFLLVLEVTLRQIPNDYLFKRNYLEKNANKIEVLFLGSSHAYYGINPEFIKPNSFNASHISQSLNYDLEILKRFEKQCNNLKYVLIPVDYFSLYTTLETSVEEWRIKNYTIYYGINSRNKYSDFFELLNGQFRINFSRFKNYYIRKRENTDLTCNELGWGTNYTSDKNDDLIKTGKSAAIRHTSKNDACLKQNIEVLNQLILLAKSKNIKVIFYTSPAYKTYTSQLNKYQLASTIQSVDSIAKTNQNVKYFNFLNDTSFDKNDFYDADHFNEIGAKKFSIKMDSLISHLNR